jgi:hypothetical protein
MWLSVVCLSPKKSVAHKFEVSTWTPKMDKFATFKLVSDVRGNEIKLLTNLSQSLAGVEGSPPSGTIYGLPSLIAETSLLSGMFKIQSWELK